MLGKETPAPRIPVAGAAQDTPFPRSYPIVPVSASDRWEAVEGRSDAEVALPLTGGGAPVLLPLVTTRHCERTQKPLSLFGGHLSTKAAGIIALCRYAFHTGLFAETNNEIKVP